MPAKITDKTRRELEERLRTAQQPRRNEIAREFGLSQGTVSKVAREIGISFARAQTEKITRAAAADNAANVEKLSARLVAEANLLMDTLHKPFLVYNFGGRENVYEEHTLDEPPIEAKRQIFTMAAIAVDKVLKVRQETKGTDGNDSLWAQFLMMAADVDGIDYSSPAPPEVDEAAT